MAVDTTTTKIETKVLGLSLYFYKHSVSIFVLLETKKPVSPARLAVGLGSGLTLFHPYQDRNSPQKNGSPASSKTSAPTNKIFSTTYNNLHINGLTVNLGIRP